jgi:hypothetical protein
MAARERVVHIVECDEAAAWAGADRAELLRLVESERGSLASEEPDFAREWGRRHLSDEAGGTPAGTQAPASATA